MRTRTFAEICARQGQLDEAIAIYRELIVKQPDDLALAARRRELELERDGLVAAGLLPTSPSPAPEPEPPPPPGVTASAPLRPLPTDLPPRGQPGLARPSGEPPRPGMRGAKKKAAAQPASRGPLDAAALARLRRLERLERLLHRIQNRRRKTHA
ncbi:MAG: tetratricopeptide repeat protein [Deltaproteobacteria bacterium]|nr:tetratricopeptide repeat protein [Deltaproteobacteria bacterium]